MTYGPGNLPIHSVQRNVNGKTVTYSIAARNAAAAARIADDLAAADRKGNR